MLPPAPAPVLAVSAAGDCGCLSDRGPLGPDTELGEQRRLPPHPVNYFSRRARGGAAAWDVFGGEVLEVSLVAEDY